MALNSRFFEVLLTNGMHQTGQRVIELKDFSKAIWKTAMMYIYEGILRMDTLKSAFELMEFARCFVMDPLETDIA